MKRGVQRAERGVRNLVAADVSPLHLIPREVRADSRRLLRLGSSARSACVFLWLLFIASSHARPFRKTADDIPDLAPPLPEILPTFWEQHGWMLWIAALFLLLVITVTIAGIWLRPRKPPVLPATTAQTRAELTAMQGRAEDGAMLSQISQVLRRYLVTAFWLHPGETTTAEFCVALTANTKVGPELSGAVSEFLRACDERKFSPGVFAPPLDAARRALKLVELTEAGRHSLAQVKLMSAPR